MNPNDRNTRQMLDTLTARLLTGWRAEETAQLTAAALRDALPTALRSILADSMLKQPRKSLDRLAALSPEVREILREASGEDWILDVFQAIERLGP